MNVPSHSPREIQPNLQVLIGTLYSGEREFDECVEALKAQKYCYRSHVVIEHLPDNAAHDQLYKQFMQHSGEFDLFLKLDADMVLSDPDKLGAAVSLFEQSPNLDHAVFSVQDWMTSSSIIGIHMYRSRVRWAPRRGQPGADSPPELQGQRRHFTRSHPSPLAVHSPNPGPAQAFRYGLRCAIKAFQIGPTGIRPVQAITHWRLLRRLWRRFDLVRDPRLGLALMAAEHALTHDVSVDFCNYTNPRFWQLLNMYTSMTPVEVHDHLRPMWARRVRRESMWVRTFTQQLVGRPWRFRKAG